MTRQEFLTLQLAALDALDRKVLVTGVYTDYANNHCAIGAFLSSQKGVPPMGVRSEIIAINDLDRTESPAARFVRVRKWVAAQLGGESTP